jgi:hypothetical protein
MSKIDDFADEDPRSQSVNLKLKSDVGETFHRPTSGCLKPCNIRRKGNGFTRE